MNMQIDLGTVLIAVLGAIIGGWASSYFQFSIWKKTEKANFLWDFQHKLFEAERNMWETKNYRELMIPLNWLSVAANDPRVNIDIKLIDDYSEIVLKGWKNLMASYEESCEEDYWGINTVILDEIKTQRNEINRLIGKKMKKLRIK